MKCDKLNHWYGWNGGECPVHPETIVEAIIRDPGTRVPETIAPTEAGGFTWDSDDYPILAFQVIKEHKEPIEFWVASRFGKYTQVHREVSDAILVREVLDTLPDPEQE